MFGFLFMLMIFPFQLKAEYRAYELMVRNLDSGTEKRVISTLDHLQYAQYYPIKNNETVVYTNSWRCRGNTGGFRRICGNPKGEPQPLPKPNSAP